jgi:hypothetical protein
MKELIERLERLDEAVSGSVQTGDTFITYKQDGDRIDYTVWGKVLPYFGSRPAKDAIFIHMNGRTPDSLPELFKRQQMTHGGRGALMRYQGKEEGFPYTTGPYRGDTLADIKKKHGYETVRLRDEKKVKP